MMSLFSRLLTDALNRAQTSSWKDYVAVTAQTAEQPEPDTGLAPRGLTDDEELRRLGWDEEAIEEVEGLLRTGDIGGSSY